MVQRDDPATGGALRVAYELVKRLPDHEIDARLLFLYGSEGYFHTLIPDRCDYLHVGSSKEIWKFASLRTYLQKMRPDVLHSHDDLLWPQVVTMGDRNWKTIIHAHNGGVARPQPVKTRMMYALQRHYGEAVVCITHEAFGGQIQNVGFRPERLQVIYNGVDRSIFRPAADDDRVHARKRLSLAEDIVVIGFVGRLHDFMKGCLDFVDLLSLLPDRFIGLVVGSGPDGAAMRSRGQALGVSDRLVFAGLRDDVVVAYQAMDVFCFLSRYEPFGLTIAEAMACGVPVVGFACPGGSGELLTDVTGRVIHNRDLDAMALEVQRAVRKEDPWPRRLATASDILTGRHDWESAAGRLASLYRELVEVDEN